jgi:hypothetical protein
MELVSCGARHCSSPICLYAGSKATAEPQPDAVINFLEPNSWKALGVCFNLILHEKLVCFQDACRATIIKLPILRCLLQ